MKFGGTSVADAERLAGVAEIVRAARTRQPVVVVSALAGVTDLLVAALGAARAGDRERLEAILADLERRHRWALAGSVEDARRRHDLGLELDRSFEALRGRLRSIRILNEGTPRIADAVLAFGEQLAARIATAAFLDRGLPAVAIEPREVMVTDERFGAAEPRLELVRERCERILVPRLAEGAIPVVGGFVGVTVGGETTTLGRGGSDTSAAVLGMQLDAEEIQIWTDVDGLMSADPRLVPAARTLSRVSFAEAAELASFGARVLHPASIAPAVERRRIPVRVLNSLRPSEPGTLILDAGAMAAEVGPVAVASRVGLTVVRAAGRKMRMDPEHLHRVLEQCGCFAVAPELVLSSGIAVTLATPSGTDAAPLAAALGEQAEVELLEDRALVGVVGSALVSDGPLLGRVLSELARWAPDLVVQGASRTSVLAVLARGVLERAVGELHRRFFEGSGAP